MDGLTLPQQALICLTYGVTLVCSGLALYGTARRFLTVRSLGWGKAILFLTFGISTGMVIWVGDPNLLYVFPLFVFFSMLSTQGDWMGRLAVTIIFFCIISRSVPSWTRTLPFLTCLPLIPAIFYAA